MTGNPFSLADRVILVTGASRGLGWAMAQGIAEAGAHVILNGRSADRLGEREAELHTAGLMASTAAFDVADHDAARSSISGIESRFGRLDGLICNAGFALSRPLAELTYGEWRHVLATDLDANFLLAQAAAEPMRRRGGGTIVFNASVLGIISRANVSAYSAAKAGLIGLTRSLAAELGPKNIRCNAIAPGYFVTDGTKAIHADPAFNQRIRNRTPLGRWGKPAELAGIAVFLMSDASSYVNGAVIPIDGGLTAVL